WRLLVLKWEALEKASICTDKSLPSMSRPPSVGDWIKRARSHTWCPNIVDIQQYQEQFWKWWKILQPKWRKSSDKLLDANLGSDWSTLHAFGKNGLVSVLASLYFWGRNIK
ncbi:hypothetical protein M378DRAFT_36637, partial [Amanita muscaria Koide BX008]